MAIDDDAGPLGKPADPTERLSADDMATLREGQFLAAALARHQRQAQAVAAAPGRCHWCRAACLPQAVYCDEDCRADHEERQRVLRRQGRA